MTPGPWWDTDSALSGTLTFLTCIVTKAETGYQDLTWEFIIWGSFFKNKQPTKLSHKVNVCAHSGNPEHDVTGDQPLLNLWLFPKPTHHTLASLAWFAVDRRLCNLQCFMQRLFLSKGGGALKRLSHVTNHCCLLSQDLAGFLPA